jgi:hypothetical protein
MTSGLNRYTDGNLLASGMIRRDVASIRNCIHEQDKMLPNAGIAIKTGRVSITSISFVRNAPADPVFYGLTIRLARDDYHSSGS